MNKRKFLLLLVIFVTTCSIIFNLPKDFPTPELSLSRFKFFQNLTLKKGLDLQGGAHLVLETDMGQIPQENRGSALESAREIIARRVDLYGVTEPLIQTSKLGENYRIIVELPGIKNIDQAIGLIGKTAQLDFREPPPSTESGQSAEQATPSAFLEIFNYKKTALSGADLKSSSVQFSQETGKPVVALAFNSQGAKKFAEITERNVGKRLAIFLDEMPITAPVVNEPITSGDAIITGDFTAEYAKNLSIQLNAGALPVPIKIVEQRNIGATLGEESVKKSVRAGLFGLLMVASFMIAYYGKLGFFADIGLVIYGLITLSLYKLIPVTLTLPGIAGFILSVGMAVDANILIFERAKEELRSGSQWREAMEAGFGRAWDSIKDANIATLITCFVLFNPFNWGFLNTSGMIRGFALTLGLGVIISLFTGIVVTRTLLRTFYKR